MNKTYKDLIPLDKWEILYVSVLYIGVVVMLGILSK